MNEAKPQGCLAAIFRLLSGSTQPVAEPELPYRRRDYLLTKAERSFYGVLQQIASEDWQIFAMVRLADLLYLPRGTERRQSYQNRIQSKHIDFVLCRSTDVRPILAIELDDSSHARRDRSERDRFVDQALQAAGLPLLRVRAQRTYDPRQLLQSIREALES